MLNPEPHVECVWPLGAELGEGACWSVREQSLYFVDILGQRLHRYTPGNRMTRSWSFDESISAVVERAHASGVLVSLRHDLAIFQPDDGSLTRLHRPDPQRPDNRFNDGKCDARGRFWIGSTDHACVAATGALFSFDGNGHCQRHLDGIHIANGPTWSADGRTLFFNETGHARTFAFDFDPERGTLGERRLWRQFDVQREGVPDGMTTDAEGHVWIAHWGGSAVACYRADGQALMRVGLPTAHVTSCAFGDADLQTLYITTARTGLDPRQLAAQPLAGGLFAVRVGATGVPAACFAG